MSQLTKRWVLCNRRVDYEMRSPSLSDVCLYSFFCEHRKIKMTTRDRISFGLEQRSDTNASRERPLNDRWLFRVDHPQYSSHIIIRRSFPVVPVLIGPAIPRHDREDTSERYARAILTLFCPWTTVHDICHGNQTWSEALTMLQSNFLPHCMEVISNIQLLHECKQDRDHDLFQMVNKPVATKNNDTSRSCGDAFIDNVDEMIALLDTTVNPDSSLVRDNSQEPFGTLFNHKSEYFETTIAHVIGCGQFTQIHSTYDANSTTTNDAYIHSSLNTTHREMIIRKANYTDIQQNRHWQLQLKNQKEQMRRALLFGSKEDQLQVNKTVSIM